MILVIGDVMVDEYCHCEVLRISPEAPVPIVKVVSYEYRAGGAANVAANIRSLGHDVHLVGVCGNDPPGEWLRSQFRESYLSRDGNRPTTMKTRYVAQGQQLIRADREMTSRISTELRLLTIDRIVHLISRRPSVVVISDYWKGFCTPDVVTCALREAEQMGIPTIVDPKCDNLTFYRRATIVTPNQKEWDAAESGVSPKTGQALLDSGTFVLVTRGPLGMRLKYPTSLLIPGIEDYIDVTSEAKSVVDVTGAGDTVVAGLAVYRATRCNYDWSGPASRASWRSAAEFANRAAGIVVGKSGTSIVTAEEMK